MLSFAPLEPLHRHVASSHHAMAARNPLFVPSPPTTTMPLYPHGVVPPLVPSNPTNPISLSNSLPANPCLMAAALPVVRGGGTSGFLPLLVAFIAGGLFFSTAVASVGAVFAIGTENVARVLEVAKIVIGHVWQIFCSGLNDSRITLLTGRPDKWLWNWRDAWAVLRTKIKEARRAAQDGVEAIRLEASLYAAAVGQPGLIAVQYLVNHFTPKLAASQIEKEFKNALKDVKISGMRKIRLTSFDIGTKPPELLAARAYDLGDESIAFDVDTKWESELKATVKMTGKALGFSVPVTVKNVRFDGVIRVILSPLIAEPPGFGAILVSLPTAPALKLDVRLAGGDITKVPWLRSEIMSGIQKSLAEQFLWPKRAVIPSESPPQNPRTILTKQKLDELQKTDPLLDAEEKLARNSVVNSTKLKKEMPDSKNLDLDVSVEDENIDIEPVEEAMRMDEPLPSEQEPPRESFWDRLVKRFRSEKAAKEATSGKGETQGELATPSKAMEG